MRTITSVPRPRRLLAAALGVLSAAALGPRPAAAEVFVIAPGAPNAVRFVSKAPMETVEGKTDRVTGRLEVDPRDLGAPVALTVEVDLASLDTGIDLRNRHMRENHLHTERFPKAVFRAGRVVDPPAGGLLPGGEASFRLEGAIELHGVTRPLTVPIAARLRQDGSLEVSAEFELRLADFEIPRPKFLVMKLDEVQRIGVKLVAAPAAAAGAADPADAPGAESRAAAPTGDAD